MISLCPKSSPLIASISSSLRVKSQIFIFSSMRSLCTAPTLPAVHQLPSWPQALLPVQKMGEVPPDRQQALSSHSRTGRQVCQDRNCIHRWHGFSLLRTIPPFDPYYKFPCHYINPGYSLLIIVFFYLSFINWYIFIANIVRI